jgi:hypothetical protein
MTFIYLIALVWMRSAEKCLSTAGTVLKGQPDHRRTIHFSQPSGNIFRSFLISDSQAKWRSDNQRGTELYEGATTDVTLQQSFVDCPETIENSSGSYKRV